MKLLECEEMLFSFERIYLKLVSFVGKGIVYLDFGEK